MTLLILEALAALAVLAFIVWWTMFSGRRGGERRADDHPRARRGKDGGSNGGSQDAGEGDGGGGDGGGD